MGTVADDELGLIVSDNGRLIGGSQRSTWTLHACILTTGRNVQSTTTLAGQPSHRRGIILTGGRVDPLAV